MSPLLVPSIVAASLTLTTAHAASIVGTNSLGELFYYSSSGDVASVSDTTTRDGAIAMDSSSGAAQELPALQLIQAPDAPLLQYARSVVAANSNAVATTAAPLFRLLSTLDSNSANRVSNAGGEHADQLQAAVAGNADAIRVSALQDNNLAAQLGMLYAVDSSTVRTNQTPHSLIFVPGTEERAALYTTWHHDTSNQPAPVVLSRVMLERLQNRWRILPDSASISSAHAIDGLLSPARVQHTAWESLLFDEQINPALTREWNRDAMSGNNDAQNLDQAAAAFNAMMLRESNPLRYGFLVELSAPNGNQPRWSRHYAAGRLASTGSSIMPDAKTVYRCDCDNDGGSGLLFKFVSDYANNLASGTLYVARLTAIDDTDGSNGAQATEYAIQWQRLAHGSNEEVSAWISEYEGMTAKDYQAGSSSYLDAADVEQWATDWHETSAAQDSDNFSDQREYRDSRVAFLEPAKAALSIGASPLDTALARIAFDGEHLLLLDQPAADNAESNTKQSCARLLEGHLDADYNLIRLRSLGQLTLDPQSPDTPYVATAEDASGDHECFDTTALEPVLFGNNRFLPRPLETFWQNRDELLVLRR